jgi:NUMOD4 motif
MENTSLIWRDVVGYEGLYEVSNNGLIRTKEGKQTYTEHHGWRTWKQRVLKAKLNKKDGYYRVSLWRDGEEKTHLVHRLVAEAFIPRVEGKDYINHIDGKGNHVSNLEWCDHDENNNHMFDTDLTTINHKVKLVNLDSGENFYFRSKAKASEFLGKNHSFIHTRLKRGHTTADNFKIYEIND